MLASSRSAGRLLCSRCMRIPKRKATFAAFTPAINTGQLALPLFFLSPTAEPDPFEQWMRICLVLGYSVAHLRQDDIAQRADIASRISQSGSPWPPLMFAKGISCLAAQDYVESNPLAGLVLIDPSMQEEQRLKRHFRWEPHFPVAVVNSQVGSTTVAQHRLLTDYSQEVPLIDLPQPEPFSEEGFKEVQKWMDARGL